MSAEIFKTLREDHDKQRTLLDLVGKTKGDSEGRRELFARLKRELEEHAMAEEKSLYAAMMSADGGQEKARHSVAEHKDIDDIVEQLEEMEMSNPRWLATFDRLKHKVLHHLEEEEHEIFQAAGRVLDDERKESLNEVFVEAHPRM
ncbi:MAG: hemerythrin domain-containing protein [Nannocystaceae bacterium]|nr:hemerythrin domain-containing protein [bacterium]